MRMHLAMYPMLALLLAQVVVAAPAKRARGAQSASGAALLDSALARHHRAERYRLQVLLTQQVLGGPVDQRIEIPMLLAADRLAGRSRSEIDNPSGPSITISDGDTLWGYAPSLGQYTQKASRLAAASEPMVGQVNGSALHPLLDMAPLMQGVLSSRTAGRDTLRLADRVLDCDRVEVRYAPDTSASGISNSRRTHWIDRATGLVVRDSAEITVEHPQRSTMSSILERRALTLAMDPVFPDSLFRFVRPADAVRVRRLGVRSGESALTGKPASDFTLSALEGEGIQLSALKGEVVVLDFWATWCGPCRRWMPIVQKAHDALAGKGVHVFAVNLREDPLKVRQYLAQTGVRVPVLMDRDGAVGAAYGAQSIPLTVVIGRDGLVVDTLLGVHGEDDLRESLRMAGVEEY